MIKADAKNQILSEFIRLWQIIEDEFQIAGHLHSFSLERISEENILNQFDSIRNLVSLSPAAAGMMIGRFLEKCCKLLISRHDSKLKKKAKTLVNQIEYLKDEGMLKDNECELFNKIRMVNNKIKHQFLNPKSKDIRILCDGFYEFLKTNDKLYKELN